MMDDYRKYIAASRYAKWQEDLGRRETWEETVGRYFEFFSDKLDATTKEELGDAVFNHEVMPSMRCVMSAGKALERDNVAGYNCSYLPVDHPRAFDETMYILLCGTGVGFSVERQYINKLPEVAEEFHETDSTIIVPDSKLGWASSFRELISMLFAGRVPRWDVSKVRPAGSPLKTFGGRASGPEPLEELFKFSIELFKRAAGRKLNSLECHDLMCKVADIVVVGGVRRSALISLSNLTDERMRGAKAGAWWDMEPQRKLANNSVAYTEKPDMAIWMKEGLSLYESYSGERGIFNRRAAERTVANIGRREVGHDWGCNPCSEIILRPNQFCNLSEVIVRPDDTLDTLRTKVRQATILGTLQSTLTDFRYLRKIWQTNTEEERLLGVSLTGIMDHPVLSGQEFRSGWPKHLGATLQELKEVAIETNKEWAEKLGVPASAAITCIKPSGTVSQLTDTASGIHPRYAQHYIRRVRNDASDPIAQFLIEQGVPHEQEIDKPGTLVFSFPMEAPEGSVLRNDMSAIEQLEHWKLFQESWCEHKPSITVYYEEHEFLDAWSWIYKNFDCVSGVSLLPKSNHIYPQAPYEEIDKAKYDELVAAMPAVDWERLGEYETSDQTEGAQELACVSGVCEV